MQDFKILMFVMIISGLITLFLICNADAAQWCQKDGTDQPVLSTCTNETVLPSGSVRINTPNGIIGGDDANKNDIGYFKMVAGENPPLQEFQTYSGWLYEFANNEWTKIRQVVSNYDNMTLGEFKWQKYWSFYNEHVLTAREADCTFNGQVIPKEARDLMVEASAANKTMTYEVYSESTGNPAYYTGSAVQVQGILDACLDAIDTVNSNMKTKGEAIMACADGDCVNAITW